MLNFSAVNFSSYKRIFQWNYGSRATKDSRPTLKERKKWQVIIADKDAELAVKDAEIATLDAIIAIKSAIIALDNAEFTRQNALHDDL